MWREEEMFRFLKKYEKFMVQVLMVLMAVVLGFATLDLGWLVVKDVIQHPFMLLSVDQLLDIFGLFMLVVIGIELLETLMKAYITDGQPHYEVVLSVAIIAIARKVIILDFRNLDGFTLMGIASVVIALTLGYFLVKKGQSQNKEE